MGQRHHQKQQQYNQYNQQQQQQQSIVHSNLLSFLVFDVGVNLKKCTVALLQFTYGCTV